MITMQWEQNQRKQVPKNNTQFTNFNNFTMPSVQIWGGVGCLLTTAPPSSPPPPKKKVPAIARLNQIRVNFVQFINEVLLLRIF